MLEDQEVELFQDLEDPFLLQIGEHNLVEMVLLLELILVRVEHQETVALVLPEQMVLWL
jgi:hypothetical protein